MAAAQAWAAPFAYITNRGSDDITVVDVATATAVATIPATASNFSNYGVAVHPGGARVYVTHNGTGNAVSIIDTATNTRTGAITVAADPLGIAINPAGTRAYVAHNPGTTVTVLDTVANSVIGSISVSANPAGVAITPDGARAYVTHSPGNTVTVINTATDTVLTTVTVGTNPFGIAVNPAGTKVYVTHTNTGDIQVIDTATNTVTATIGGGNTPYGVVVSPDGSKVYQTDSGANTVRVISTATNTVTATIGVGTSPQGISITPDGARVYAVNQASNDVSVINTATNAVVATVPVGSGPRAFGLFIGGPTGPLTAPTISPSFASFGNVPLTVPISQTVTVTATATITFTSFSTSDARFTVAGSGATPCAISLTLSPGQACTYALTFTPTGPGAYNNTTTIGYNNALGAPFTVTQNANGTGFPPPFTLSTPSIGFGNQVVGVPATQSFTFTNTSNTTSFPSTYTLTGFTTSGLGFTAAGSGATPCAVSLTLAAGASCGVTVTFTPSGTGSTNGTSTLNFLAGLGADPPYVAQVALNGNGVTGPVATITGSGTFPNTVEGAGSAVQAITLQNTGGANLTLSAITLTAPGIFVDTTGGPAPNAGHYCGFGSAADGSILTGAAKTLTPGQSCTINLIFTPKAQSNYNYSLAFTTDAAGSPHMVALSGTAAAPTINLGPALNFANQVEGTASAAQTVTLTNASPVAITLTSAISVSSAGPFSVSPSGAIPCTSGLVLAGGASCTASVVFAPTSVGSFGNGLTVSYQVITSLLNTGSSLGGNSLAPTFTLGPALNFGSVAVGGSSAAQTVTFTNTSPTNLTVTVGPSSSNAVFSATPSGATPCNVSTVVPPAGTCTFSSIFTPAGLSSYGASYNMTVQAVTSLLPATAAASGTGIAAPTGPYVYIANQAGANVSVINPGTNTVVATIPVGGTPRGVAVNVAGTRAYVANQGSGSLSVIDTTTNTVIASPAAGPGPSGIALNQAGTRAYIANVTAQSVTVLDTATNTQIGTVTVGSQPIGITVSPTGAYVYVANYVSGTVSVIETTGLTVVATVTVGSSPRGIAINPAGTRVYVANETSGTVSVVDTATNLVTATIPGTNPSFVAVNGAGTKLYVADGGSDNLLVIDTATNTQVGAVPVGVTAFGVAVNAAGTIAYVPNLSSNTVSVIDLGTLTVAATVTVGSNPASFGAFTQPAAVATTAPSITSSAPVAGTVGTAYSHAFTAGGTGPTGWSIATGTLPAGLTLNPVSGVLAGTPTTAGTFGFTIQAANGVAPNATQNVSITVAAAAGSSYAPTTLNFGNVTVGVTSASQQVTFTNTGASGVTLSSVSFTGGGAGFAIVGTSQCLSTPTLAPGASCTFDITATPNAIGTRSDSVFVGTIPAIVSVPANVALQVVGVGPLPVVTSASTASGTVGVAFTYAITATNSPTSFAATGLPPGLTINTATGAITGTPTTAGTFSGSVSATNPNGTGSLPTTFTIAAAPATGPFAYVPIFNNFAGSTVSVIDLPTNTLATTINVGLGPVSAAVNFAGTKAYVANQQANSVSVIDTATNTVVATVPVGSQPGGVAVNPADSRVYVPNQTGNSLSVIDTATNTVSATVTGLGFPVAAVVHPTGLKAYVALNSANALGVIDTTTNTLSNSIPVCSAPYQPVIDAAGTKVYVVCTSGSVSVVDTSTGSVVATVPVGTNARGIAITAGGSEVWVTNTGSNNVSVISTATNAVINTLTAGTGPWGLASNAAGTRMYVANNGSNNVSVFDTANKLVLATVATGTGPIGTGQFLQPAAVAAVPALILTPSTLNFGVRTVNTTSPPSTVTLTNAGAAAVFLSNITSTGDYAFTTTCPLFSLPLNAGASCTISISFTPLTPAAIAGTVSITSGAPGSPHVVNLTGTGAAVGVTNIAVNPTSLDFGTQTVGTASAPFGVLVSNTGFANLLLSGVTLTGPFVRVARATSPPDCGTSVAPGAACTLSLVFTPAVTGGASGQVSIAHNATGSPTLVSLTGVATPVPVPVLSVAPRIVFGDQVLGVPVSAALNLSNTGTANLNIGAVSLTGSPDFTLAGSCGVIAPSSSCVVNVGFRPTSVGPRSAQIDITSNTGSTQAATVITPLAVTGTGILAPRPVADVDATAIGFGNTIFGGASVGQKVTLTSTGSAPLEIRNVFTSGPDFIQSSSCPGSLPTGATCVINVMFSPLSIGSKTGELQIITNAVESPNRVLLSGRGCRWFSQTASRFFLTSCGN